MFRTGGLVNLYVSALASVAAITSLAICLCGCSANQTTINLGTIATVAGTGRLGDSGDGGSATSAQLKQPSCAVLDSAGNIYIGDLGANTIRKVSAGSGIISLYAGNGVAGYRGDGGPATEASMYAPAACALDSAGNLYVADDANSVIRKITASTGIITTVAGNGLDAGDLFPTGGFSGDGGLATQAELNHPFGVAVDAAGNLYISDTGNQRVREMSAATGIITTIAGNGSSGYSDSGGTATKITLGNPENLALDGSGNLYITEQGNCVVVKLNLSAGTITTVAGSGPYGLTIPAGDGGLATKAKLASPDGIAVDAAGNLFVSDTSSDRVREVSAANGIVVSVVGSTQGYSGDGGPSDRAQLSNPLGLFFDASGELFIADSGNGAVRKVTVAR